MEVKGENEEGKRHAVETRRTNQREEGKMSNEGQPWEVKAGGNPSE